MTVDVSVVVISKDDLPGLTRTLRSIEQQTTRPCQVVVVTKGDSGRLRLEDFALDGALHLAQQDAGISAAFNLALSQVRGEWVNFLNGGDLYADERALACLAKELCDDVDILAARAVDRLNGNLIPRDLYFRARRVDQVSHQASLFRAALFGRHGAYSPAFRVRMDFEWMLRVIPFAKVAWLDDVVVNFEGGGLSSTEPARSVAEEWRALCLHRQSPLRRARLLLFFLPFRLARAQLRRLVS